jgi:hypothetical protein
MWEDDDIQHDNPDFAGGANKMSLNEAKSNFAKMGAKGQEAVPHARPPLPDEMA